MTPRLTRIRIAGFKSFAEPVSLDILPGLTGIVGPNGCGKSNVVEALRWAMGETSARSLRGGEMDDVIFAGTTARASRNLAEVTITLETAGNALPAPFEAEAELQVTRRLERGAGSAFRANGRELRARDVQTLFADLASGARSSGMVSQGRVADLVRARPEERRQVLEEAAGITGLHARRHEAELKLRAAEQNLARAGDAAAQLDGTRESLRRQARQTARYRAVSGLIRAAETEHLAIQHAREAAALGQVRRDCTHAETALAAALAQEDAASAELRNAEAALPAGREGASAARSLFEKCGFEAEALAAQAVRDGQEAAAAQARVAELAADLAGAAAAEHEAKQIVERLSAAIEGQAARSDALPAENDAARLQVRHAGATLLAAQAKADQTAGAAGAAAVSAGQVRAALEAAAAQLATTQAQHASLLADLTECESRRIGIAEMACAADAVAAAEAALLTARATLDAAETARSKASEAALAVRSRSETEQARREAAVQAAGTAAARADRIGTAYRLADQALRAHASSLVDPATVLAAAEAARGASAALAAAEALRDAAEDAAASAAEQAASARRAAEDATAAQARAQDALSAARSRAARIAADLHAAETAWSAAGAGPDPAACARATALCRAAEAAFAGRYAAWTRFKAAHRSAAETRERALACLSDAGAAAARLGAEIEGLDAARGTDDGPDLLDALAVPDGLELAFGAAVGEFSGATLDGHDTVEPGLCTWRILPPLAPGPMPARSVALSSLTAAPQALARMLSHVALLEDGAEGDAVQPMLGAGMMAVDRAGACWRWDGLFKPAGAPNRAAARLGLRRRLADLRTRQATALQDAESARHALTAAEAETAFCNRQESSAGQASDAAEADWRAAKQTVERQLLEAAQAAAHRSALEPSATALRAEGEIAGQAVLDGERRAAGLPDPAILQAAAAAAAAHAMMAEQAMDAARAARGAARVRAAEAQHAAQTLAGRAAQAEAQHQAASGGASRAAADLRDAVDALAVAKTALAALPDPAVLTAALAEADAREAGCRATETEMRRLRHAAEADLDRLRQAETLLRHARMQAEAEHAGLIGQVARRQADLADAARRASLAEAAASALPDGRALDAAAEAARTTLEAARLAVHQAETALTALEAERAAVQRGLDDSRAERQAWQRRLEEACTRRAALSGRHGAAHAAWQAAAARPAEAADRTAKAAQALHAAEHGLLAAAVALAAAETDAAVCAGTLREASETARLLREQTLRLHAGCAAAEAALAALLARAAERLGPEVTLPQAAETSETAEERARKRHDRLCREREEMGPVNLRADLELEALDERIAAIARECAELGQASAKLRGAIGQLNREGRERLLAVFAQVDRHFRTLFTRMMGGGRAHLAMTGSDDPLAAGLEIFAEPPGKKMSALSLLSGGEQALTALSLIFAVFRCTPAPLCVLDEVDAPLDDANVERFCTLLDEMVRDTGTSFLVVTHHQLTMTRMNRLFGVTMQERGVSRLLSVDLRRAGQVIPVLQAAE